MKLFALTAVTALTLVVKHTQSSCPLSACECGEHCVDSNNRWCNSNNVEECSCKKGCLVYDRMLTPGQREKMYCNDCICSNDSNEGRPVLGFYSVVDWCVPDNLTIDIDYPDPYKPNPNCPTEYDDDYDKTTAEITDLE